MPKEPVEPKSPLLGVLGGRVRDRRVELGLSQEKLAEHSELHWSYISRIERGQVNLTVTSLVRVAEVLEVRPGELLDGLASSQ